jgi:hypothetical protein
MLTAILPALWQVLGAPGHNAAGGDHGGAGSGGGACLADERALPGGGGGAGRAPARRRAAPRSAHTAQQQERGQQLCRAAGVLRRHPARLRHLVGLRRRRGHRGRRAAPAALRRARLRTARCAARPPRAAAPASLPCAGRRTPPLADGRLGDSPPGSGRQPAWLPVPAPGYRAYDGFSLPPTRLLLQALQFSGS